MKDDITNLINDNNSVENGISISTSVNVYVDKIIAHSTLIPFYVKGSLNGIISYYDNDKSKQNAFLTLILISKNYQGRGLGKLLIEMSIKDLIKKEFTNYSLEVLKSNKDAIRLYKHFGFEQKEDKGQLWLMEKTLK